MQISMNRPIPFSSKSYNLNSTALRWQTNFDAYFAEISIKYEEVVFLNSVILSIET